LNNLHIFPLNLYYLQREKDPKQTTTRCRRRRGDCLIFHYAFFCPLTRIRKIAASLEESSFRLEPTSSSSSSSITINITRFTDINELCPVDSRRLVWSINSRVSSTTTRATGGLEGALRSGSIITMEGQPQGRGTTGAGDDKGTQQQQQQQQGESKVSDHPPPPRRQQQQQPWTVAASAGSSFGGFDETTTLLAALQQQRQQDHRLQQQFDAATSAAAAASSSGGGGGGGAADYSNPVSNMMLSVGAGHHRRGFSGSLGLAELFQQQHHRQYQHQVSSSSSSGGGGGPGDLVGGGLGQNVDVAQELTALQRLQQHRQRLQQQQQQQQQVSLLGDDPREDLASLLASAGGGTQGLAALLLQHQQEQEQQQQDLGGISTLSSGHHGRGRSMDVMSSWSSGHNMAGSLLQHQQQQQQQQQQQRQEELFSARQRQQEQLLLLQRRELELQLYLQEQQQQQQQNHPGIQQQQDLGQFAVGLAESMRRASAGDDSLMGMLPPVAHEPIGRMLSTADTAPTATTKVTAAAVASAFGTRVSAPTESSCNEPAPVSSRAKAKSSKSSSSSKAKGRAATAAKAPPVKQKRQRDKERPKRKMMRYEICHQTIQHVAAC
jgi:hypothetical protein